MKNRSKTASKKSSTQLTAVEYFAGIGLFRMGLEIAGWNVVYANDWNTEREQIYHGFFFEHYLVEDIFSISHKRIPQTTLATCSFPCIDLSLAGNMSGINGKHSGAFWGFHNILKKQGADSPPIVLLENVAGWLSSNHGNDLRIVAKALNELNYACDIFMLNARSFVPQSRPRIFLVAVKTKAPIAEFPYAKRSELLMPTKLKNFVKNNSDICWFCCDIPEPPSHKSSGFSKNIVEKISNSDSRWWPEDKVHKHLSMMPSMHLEAVQALTKKKTTTYKTFFRRRRQEGQRAEVRSDDIAGCLRTATGGSGKQFLIAAGNGKLKMRTLIAREYARLQGVPDEFPITTKTERQALNAFGDAVCVPAVEWIAKNVLTPLAHQCKK